MKLYAIDQFQRAFSVNHNGHKEPQEFWMQVLTLKASRSSNAIRVADARWPGHRHRARLLSNYVSLTR
jgi:hypothetical protein